jgi:hypothetical protein
MPVAPLSPVIKENKDVSGVTTVHPKYTEMLPLWTIMEDVCKSEYHMHKQGERYIYRLDKMTDAQYAAYVNRAEFPLYTKHAMDSFVGMSMRKDLLISGIDKDTVFFNNCDGKGSSLKKYAKNLVKHFLQYSRCGTLVDMPPTDKVMSIGEAEAKNIKARLVFYNHSSIINWRTQVVNNEDTLSLVVLKEEVEVSDNIFSHTTESQYRVLLLDEGVYKQRLYNNKGVLVSEHIPKMKGSPLKYIPFVIHGGVIPIHPVLLPIAEQNIHWYRKDADYQHGLHYTALPTPWMAGVDYDDPNRPTTIGPSELWVLPDGATCGMLEFSGAGLSQIEKSMDKTMTNITVLSSQILVPKNTFDETATAASIRNATETASLSSIVAFLSIELSEIVKVALQWNSLPHQGVVIEINSDFIPLTLSGADVSAYVSSFLKEGFSRRTLFDVLKKGEIVPGDRQFEDEVKDIEDESAKRRANEVVQARLIAEVTKNVVEETETTTMKDVKNKESAVDPNKAKPNSSQQIPGE